MKRMHTLKKSAGDRARHAPTGRRRGMRMNQRALWLPHSRSNMKMSGVTYSANATNWCTIMSATDTRMKLLSGSTACACACGAPAARFYQSLVASSEA